MVSPFLEPIEPKIGIKYHIRPTTSRTTNTTAIMASTTARGLPRAADRLTHALCGRLLSCRASCSSCLGSSAMPPISPYPRLAIHQYYQLLFTERLMNRYSANFAFWEFPEVRRPILKIVGRIPQILDGLRHVPQPSNSRQARTSAATKYPGAV